MPEDGTIIPEVILLDVYETLLDMQEVVRRVNDLLDSKRGYTIWFELFMQYCFVDNCTGKFNDFNSIASATMKMTANTLGRTIDQHDMNAVLELLKHLPVNEGVQEGLSALNQMNLRMAALTNSPESTVIERMERTGLISYFERVFSAEKIRKYKPCKEVYEWAAKELGVSPDKILLVSAHGWDIAGGANAGMQTTYLQQSKQMLYPLAPAPDLTVKNLEHLAQQLNEKLNP